MDNPAISTTIVLISGSFNLAYSMSVLRMRRYHLVLLAPNERVNRHLKYQATEFLDWNIPLVAEDARSLKGLNWGWNGYDRGKSVLREDETPAVRRASLIGASILKMKAIPTKACIAPKTLPMF